MRLVRVERPRSVSLSALAERRKSDSKLRSPAVPSGLTDADVALQFDQFLVGCFIFLE